MHIFQTNDIVGFTMDDRGYVYGIVTSVVGDELIVDVFDDESYEPVWIRASDVDYLEPIAFDKATAAALARFDIDFFELSSGVEPPQRLYMDGKYRITMDDMLSALEKASDMPASEFEAEWYAPINYFLNKYFDFGQRDEAVAGDSGYRFLPSEEFFVWNAMDLLEEKLADEDNDYTDIIEDLRFIQEQLRLPVPERQYDDHIKRRYVYRFDEGNMLNEATDKELSLFIDYVNELCDKGDAAAMSVKAYGCYGGNRAFPCDWTESRDLLLKLCEKEENPFYANTLGYIYYYGRCTNGVPDYENAFRYYSIGAAGGVYESRYKLSDMFRYGYGVPKNARIAASIIWELYDSNIRYIMDGHFDCKFADIAFRAGSLLRDGVGCAADNDDAYYHYLRAEFAIRMRMKEMEFFGDRKVAAGIESAIEDILPDTSYIEKQDTVRYYNAHAAIADAYPPNRQIALHIEKSGNGELLLTFRIKQREDEKYQPKLFITEPRAHFCGLCTDLTLKTVGFFKLTMGKKPFVGGSADIVFDSVRGNEFYLYGTQVADIKCESFTCRFDDRGGSKKLHFAAVVFSNGGHTYDYICDIPDVKVGDMVIVNTPKGEQKVEVVRLFDKDETETALPIEKYKYIIRKA